MDFEATRVVWRGIEFDSRLEANWYASLLFWGCDVVHHPATVELSTGEWYEPDYLLKNAGEWGVDIMLEVKGAHNERVHKPEVLQEMHPGAVVLIGREPWLDPRDVHSEYAGAVWERADGSAFEWDLNGRGQKYVSAELSGDLPGLTFVSAIGTRQIR